jgi:uncharacterized repeat protein (TIGR01451 family)
MKNIIKRLPKKVTSVLMTLVLIAGITSTAIAAFGPSRPTKAWNPNIDGFDHVTFNSFTGVPNGIGDERDFMRGVQVGRDSVWSDPVKNVTQDAEVEAKIYIHNGADARLNDLPGSPGIARNVRVRVALPNGVKQTQQATAYISADNAQPREVFDTLDITGANNGFFSLEYVPGSAKLHRNNAATPLSDSLVTTGVNIGDQRGCFETVEEITYRMKVKMPQYMVNKFVRFEGQTKNDWKKHLTVKPGQVVEWKVEFDNIGRTLLNDVIILDQVPANTTVVPGSVKLVDGNFPNGYVYKDNEAIQNNGTQINVNIGNVNPGINSVILFKTKVNSTQELECGSHKLINTGFATPKGFTTVKDTAEVDVVGEKKDCVPPTPTPQPQPGQPQPSQPSLPVTGAGDIVGIFAATTIAGAVAYRFVWLRRFGN